MGMKIYIREDHGRGWSRTGSYDDYVHLLRIYSLPSNACLFSYYLAANNLFRIPAIMFLCMYCFGGGGEKRKRTQYWWESQKESDH
jgi:hypothetical protein